MSCGPETSPHCRNAFVPPPQAFLSLACQCRDGVSELREGCFGIEKSCSSLPSLNLASQHTITTSLLVLHANHACRYCLYLVLCQTAPCAGHVHSNSDCLTVAAGELLPMFKACMPVTRCDIQSARFLMPYLLHNVISAGSPESRKGAAPSVHSLSHACPPVHSLSHSSSSVYSLSHSSSAVHSLSHASSPAHSPSHSFSSVHCLSHSPSSVHSLGYTSPSVHSLSHASSSVHSLSRASSSLHILSQSSSYVHSLSHSSIVHCLSHTCFASYHTNSGA